jgi:ABC-type sulfate/molybdate transport systems ATPase subunit
MQVRLAFSLMVQSDAEVLLIDEVLAVGDAAFQQKCFNEFYRLRDEGRTIVLVTHDMTTIERFCHRAMLLERGVIVSEGDPSDVGARYLELNFEHQRGRAGEEQVSQVATVESAWVEVDGRSVDSVAHGTPFTIHAIVEAREPVERPELHLRMTTDDGSAVFGTTTAGAEDVGERLEPGQRVHLKVTLENILGSGRYYVDVGVHSAGGGMVAYRGRAKDFMVHGSPEDSGLVAIPHRVELEREGTPAQLEVPR